MRHAWVVGLAALFVASTALAQNAGDSQEPPAIEFARGPDARDFARFYPSDAWEEGRDGRVVLCCLVSPNGELACADVGESPAGLGFGQAARRVALAFRLTPSSAAAWLAHGGPLRLPINFRAPDGAPAPEIEPEPRCGVQAQSMDHASPAGGDFALARQSAAASER